MKTKLKILIALSFIGMGANAQHTLWSMTQYNGAAGIGSVFKINLNGSGYATPYIFSGSEGVFPAASLIKATNGKLYGMTPQGGLHGAGVLFSFDRNTGTYDTLHNFTASVTQGPTGNLIQAANGKLYGLILTGGSSNAGVLFSFDILTGAYDTLHSFVPASGELPFGSLVLASDGKMYGMTYTGGDNFDGVIFSFDPVTNIYSYVFSFNAINGQGPYGDLMQAANGKLYGMTRTGGTGGVGNIFSFNPVDSTLISFFNFTIPNGSKPYGGLTEVAGQLYGLTSEGGTNGDGVIFRVDTSGNNFTVLENFDGALHGAHPFGSLFHASNGLLYGMTNSGGTSNAGVLFSFDTIINNLRSLNVTADGNYPLYSNFIEIIDSTTSINSLDVAESPLSVFPEPAKTTVIIQSRKNYSYGRQLLITDVNGKEIYQQIITEENTKIDVSRWSRGIYFYDLKGTNRTGKIVIER